MVAGERNFKPQSVCIIHLVARNDLVTGCFPFHVVQGRRRLLQFAYLVKMSPDFCVVIVLVVGKNPLRGIGLIFEL